MPELNESLTYESLVLILEPLDVKFKQYKGSAQSPKLCVFELPTCNLRVKFIPYYGIEVLTNSPEKLLIDLDYVPTNGSFIKLLQGLATSTLTESKNIGIESIKTAREAQILKGYSFELDKKYIMGELAGAALCYVIADGSSGAEMMIKQLYPWEYKKELFIKAEDTKGLTIATRLINLAKAGALIAAEIDRLSTYTEEEAVNNTNGTN